MDNLRHRPWLVIQSPKVKSTQPRGRVPLLCDQSDGSAAQQRTDRNRNQCRASNGQAGKRRDLPAVALVGNTVFSKHGGHQPSHPVALDRRLRAGRMSRLRPAQVRVAAPPRLCHIGRHRGVVAQVINSQRTPESLVLPRLTWDIAGRTGRKAPI